MELVCQRCHHIAWDGAYPSFGATLAVVVLCDAVDLLEDVVACDFQQQIVLHEGTREGCIPHPVAGVHGRSVAARTDVETKVGDELDVAWELQLTAEHVLMIERRASGEARAFAIVACPVPSACQRYLILTVWLAHELQ